MRLVALALVLVASAAPPDAGADAVEIELIVEVAPTCALRPVGGTWEGSCGALVEGEPTALSLAPAAAIASGVWRRDEAPSAVWAGTMVVAGYPPVPVEIEAYADRRGAMRTPFGWFTVARFDAASGALEFDVDAAREVAPSGVDRQIIERAAAILSSEARWNRADTRRCADAAAVWSLYCAAEKATIEIAGAFHHRRPALQVVRAIVDERTAGRPYEHRLMEYNNDPTTRLADVHSLFAEALERIDAASGHR